MQNAPIISLLLKDYCRKGMLQNNQYPSDSVTNSYGESGDSSCEKSWVKKILWPLCVHPVNLKMDSKTLYYSMLKLS